MLSNIKKGDIIFFPTNGAWWDYFIRLVSPKYTHIGIITDVSESGKLKMIDSNFFGIKEHDIETYHGVTIRRIDGIEDFEIEEMIKFLKSCQGGRYSFFGGIWAGILRKLNLTSLSEPKDKFFHCSELVTRAIRKVYKDFYKNIAAENILPDDIDRWDKLKTIHEFMF